jgi:hypothetical protein
VRGEYLRPSEVSERVHQDGLEDALYEIPAHWISPESEDLRWWWTVAHNYRLPSGEFSPYDLARIRMAL